MLRSLLFIHFVWALDGILQAANQSLIDEYSMVLAFVNFIT